MRSRLGGIAVALALVLAGCGSDDGSGDASAEAPGADGAVALDLVSARDTLPPAPATAGRLTVLLTHPGGALDAGLDAAVAALAQRPDLEVVIAAPGGERTMSGFPVDVMHSTAFEAVGAALDDLRRPIDLVVVGVSAGHGIGAVPPEAELAVDRGIPALVVGAEQSDAVDLAAATIQLLEVVDLELDALLGDPAAIHHLAVPSCMHGMLRGRTAASAGPAPDPTLRADCTATGPAPSLEADAFAQGWATLTVLR